MSFARANTLAELQVGRQPSWAALTLGNVAGIPDSVADGSPLSNAVVALLAVRPRVDAHRRKGVVTVTHDATTTYTVTIDGTAISKATPTSADDCLIDLRDLIRADTTVGAAASSPTVSARCLDSDGEVTEGTAAGGNAAVTLEVLGVVEDDWSLAVSVSGGSGTITASVDAAAATVTLWGHPRDPGVQGLTEGWFRLPGGVFSLDGGGMLERFQVAAVDRLYPQLSNVTGVAGDGAGVTQTVAVIAVGPAIVESSS